MSRITSLLKGNPTFRPNHGCPIETFFRVFYLFFAEPGEGMAPKQETRAICQDLNEYLTSRKP